MKFEIKHRFNGEIVFTADIHADEDTSHSIRIGLAVKAAIAVKADLSWANLSKANLSKANLSKANLSWANLSKANLSEADLSWANLSKANLSKANLSKANLSWADLSWADLSWADLSWANLSKANLSKADLRYIKHDVWGILINAIPEIPALRQAVVDGKVDGSVYEGDCACLCGTIANARHCSYRNLVGIEPNCDSMAERFFLAVRRGDTAEQNPVAKIILEWIDELSAILKKNESEDSE